MPYEGFDLTGKVGLVIGGNSGITPPDFTKTFA